MPQLSLNKATLHKESDKLRRYRQYLPSLELKRQKLVAERAKGHQQLEQTRLEIERYRNWVAQALPMLANRDIELREMVGVSEVQTAQENLVGLNLPVLKRVVLKHRHYSPYLKPHWVDPLVAQLGAMLELQCRYRIELQRLQLLELAVKKVTQKVNLFDKVLIPKTQTNIRKIRIFLSDAERADVVRAKITKQLREEALG